MIVFSKIHRVFGIIIGNKSIYLPIICALAFVFGFLFHKVIFSNSESSLSNNDISNKLYAHNEDFISFFDEFDKIDDEFNKYFKEKHRFVENLAKKHKSNDVHRKNPNSSITTRYEDDSLIYKLNFSGFENDDIVIEIEKRDLVIKAESKKKVKNLISNSNFYYSFYISNDYNTKNPEIIRNNNNIIIKFNKKD